MANAEVLKATTVSVQEAPPAPECRQLQELVGVPENCPLRIDRNEKFGRFLVTNREVTEGEVLLRELPLVLGPQAESAPVCLGCHRPLGLLAPHVCSRCGAALLCGPACESSPYHAPRECDALRDALPCSSTLLIGDTAHWQVVLPLRCFVNQPKGIFQLEAHVEARKSTRAWHESEKNVVSVLHSFGLLRNFPSNAIQRVCGILDVNSFEVRGPPDETGRSECLRGIYPNSALMAHSCLANTHVAIGTDFCLVVKAAMTIKPGQPVFHNYTDTLMCTAMRQGYLKMGKYFSCDCQRCKDPTELGTHLSSLRCLDPACPGVVLSDDPCRQAETMWQCDTCLRTLDPGTVLEGLRSVQRQLMMMDRSSVPVMEKLLTALSRSLHPQHAAMLEVIQSFSGLYRDQIMDVGDMAPPALLRRKLELCQKLLPPVDKLEPPLSRLRGITLYEMATPMAALAQLHKKSATVADVITVDGQLAEAEEKLREAARLLLHEPPDSPEAKLSRVALLHLRAVRQDRADLARLAAKKNAKNKAARKKK